MYSQMCRMQMMCEPMMCVVLMGFTYSQLYIECVCGAMGPQHVLISVWFD